MASRLHTVRGMFAAAVCAGLVSASASAADFAAMRAARRARALAARNEWAAAWLLVSAELARHPGSRELKALANVYERRGLENLLAVHPLQPAAADTAGAAEAVPELTDTERRELEPPLKLAPTAARHSFSLAGPPRQVIERAAAAYGIQVVFDADYPDTEKPIRLNIDNVDWNGAMQALALVANSFYVPVSAHVALFAKETTVKRAELEPNVSVPIPFPDTMTDQELQEIANAVRMSFALTKVSIDSKQRAMVLRDRISKVGPARELARQLLNPPAEVYVDIELLATTHSNEIEQGLTLPTSTELVNFGSGTLGIPVAPSSPSPNFSNYATFGGGATRIGVGIGSTQLVDSLTHAAAVEFTRGSLRSLTGQASTLHVGDKYPVVTQAWQTGSAQSDAALLPNISFEDLGVVVKLTPHVHDARALTLDIEAEYKSLTGTVNNSIPIISNRKFAGSLRLNFGEAVVVAGLAQQSRATTRGGWPLLNWLPGLHAGTSSAQRDDILLVLRPRLTRLPPAENPSYAIWSGTEVRSLPLDFYDRAVDAAQR